MSMQLMQSSISLLLLITKIAVALAAPLAKNNCRERCGNVTVPYPFGIGAGCYLNSSFEVSCNESSSPPTLFLTSIQMEVLEISQVPYHYYYDGRQNVGENIRVKSPIVSQNCSGREAGKSVNFNGSPFFFSNEYNIFVAAGCDNRAFLAGTEPAIVGCQSRCRGQRLFGPSEICNGETCCQVAMPSGLQLFDATFESPQKQGKNDSNSGGCKLAFLVEEDWFNNINRTDPSEVRSMDYVPAILSWDIDFESLGFELPYGRKHEYFCFPGLNGNTTRRNCYCSKGYEGNPYLPDGCQDIDECKDPTTCGTTTCVNTAGSFECQRRKFWIIIGISIGFGVLLLLMGGWWFYKFLKKRRQIKLKKKFFKRNGGLLLQQQMFSSEGGIQKAKLFDSKELEKATDHFNKNRILGRGGQGTVYKGMLDDGRIVAVKKSIIVDADKVEEFINEVVILSHINHRNVVKLLGCCLETEVPLLIYEFISNGTLFQYLHDQTEEFQLSWEMRLRIAIESADALSYLHSSASLPIYHRDIKSTNILLDEKYRAKVSDFGTSRSLAIDQTHLTTKVQGTLGYLDPEYLQSNQYTGKSDVYSFGVVLVELITGEKPISILRADEGRSLATHFMLLMEEDRLFNIADARILQDSVHDEIIAVAKLAYRCLSLSGKKRPTMKEVAVELQRIPSLQEGSNAEKTLEVENAITDHLSFAWGAASTSTGSAFHTATASSLEIEPLIYSQ